VPEPDPVDSDMAVLSADIVLGTEHSSYQRPPVSFHCTCNTYSDLAVGSLRVHTAGKRDSCRPSYDTQLGQVKISTILSSWSSISPLLGSSPGTAIATFPDPKYRTHRRIEFPSLGTCNLCCTAAQCSPDIDRSSSGHTCSLVHSGCQDTVFGGQDGPWGTHRCDYLAKDRFGSRDPHHFFSALNSGSGS